MNIKFAVKQYGKMFIQNCALPLYYAFCCRRKIDERLVVFADAHHDARPASMDALYECLSGVAEKRPDGPGERYGQEGKERESWRQEKRKDEGADCRQKRRKGEGEERGQAGRRNAEREQEQHEGKLRIVECYLDYQNASFGAVIRHMGSFMRLYAQAGAVVICDNFLPAASCRKRKGTRVIQLWHACGAYKKFGYDTEDDIPRNYRGNVFRNIDLATVSAPSCVKPFASAMRLPRECVRPLGICRTDVYFNEIWREDCRRGFYEAYPQARGRRVALWAPTFRGKAGDPKLLELDVAGLQAALGEEWLVLVRVHPHMMKKYGKDNCSIATERLFPVTDLLIADYSSLIFEYLLFGRPLVLYVPDRELYERQRGFYLNMEEIPGRMVLREEELAEAVRQEYAEWETMQPGSEKAQKRERFMETYMSACDGRAAMRVAAYITGESKAL